MITSEQQVRLAIRFGGLPAGSASFVSPRISPELMSRILLAIDATPEIRYDRVVEARQRLADGGFDSREIAEMIVARTIAEALG